jgi:hypothetical protein
MTYPNSLPKPTLGASHNRSHFDRPVKIWDIETKTCTEYKRVSDAARALGLKASTIINAQNRKGRTFSKTLNKKVAVR